MGQAGPGRLDGAGGAVLAGRYRLVGLLGRGGMGAVWRAHDEQLDRDVAVKELRLPEQLDDAGRRTWIARVDREARAAARLRHPGIVTVYDRVPGEDGRPWIVMELVRGRSLEELLKADGPLPPQQAARIGLQVLDALRAAHRAGITHRDIKPANVLLEDDRVILTDFGIAAVEGDVTLTGTGAVIGTPAYMSPEQVRGQEVTAASDLWSLGATLYTAVEGRSPFEGASTGAVFIAIATEDPPPPAQAGPLEPVLKALLHRDPLRRPTADHLYAQLAALAQDRPPPAPVTVQTPTKQYVPRPPVQPTDPQAGLPSRPPRRRPPRKAVLLAVAAATLVLVIAGSVTPWLLQMREDARYEANMSLLSGTIPGEATDLERAGDGRVDVEVILCESISASTTAPGSGCDATRLINEAAAWLRGLPGVRSVVFEDPRSRCTSLSGCSLEVITRDSLKISYAQISAERRNDPSEGSANRLVLDFTLG
ncbi:serine/threonine-protein kinase [Actinomadura sp. 21ATH]|uniref:serine/threonine-protein kinase n=1 Tax=Actinomadura sp. 21ATH TaxID=1735444 RepID=UPI0035C160C0